MSIDQLTAMKSKGGVIFICAKCQVPGMAAVGTTGKCELLHLLICPRCYNTMGEWLTIQEREEELKAFANTMLSPIAFIKS